MEHVRQTELIQLAANEIADPRRAEVERHLAECPDCQALHAQQAAVWRALGEWTPNVGQRDLVARVESKLAQPPVGLRLPWSSAGRVSRVAAAIVVGVGVGYGAGRTWQPTRPGPLPAVSAEVEQAATKALGVQYLEDPSPAGLYAALPDTPVQFDGEGGPS